MSVFFFFFFLRGKIKSHLQRENHPTQYHRQTYHQPPGVKSVCSAESHYYEAVRCSSSAFLRMQPRVYFLDEMGKMISGCRVLALQTSAFRLSTVKRPPIMTVWKQAWTYQYRHTLHSMLCIALDRTKLHLTVSHGIFEVYWHWAYMSVSIRMETTYWIRVYHLKRRKSIIWPFEVSAIKQTYTGRLSKKVGALSFINATSALNRTFTGMVSFRSYQNQHCIAWSISMGRKFDIPFSSASRRRATWEIPQP